MFPKNSAFKEVDHTSTQRLPYPVVNSVAIKDNTPIVNSSIEKTSVYTSDIEQLEHDLRTLSHSAGGPEDARVFEDLADRVASLYKG